MASIGEDEEDEDAVNARPNQRNYLATQRLHVGVYTNESGRIVSERIFPPGADVSVGDSSAELVVPEWVGQSYLVISHGHLLHLLPGMSLHMCHDNGEDRVQGTYAELVAAGVVFPLRINVSKLNVTLRDGVSVFAKYLPDD